jgi:hypothetical protein
MAAYRLLAIPGTEVVEALEVQRAGVVAYLDHSLVHAQTLVWQFLLGFQSFLDPLDLLDLLGFQSFLDLLDHPHTLALLIQVEGN